MGDWGRGMEDWGSAPEAQSLSGRKTEGDRGILTNEKTRSWLFGWVSEAGADTSLEAGASGILITGRADNSTRRLETVAAM